AMDVEIGPEPWFSIAGPPRVQVAVPAGQDSSAHFMISADHSVREGKQRVTAANRETGDAVERLVLVHPDGEDAGQSVAALLAGDRNAMGLQVPLQAIPGSIEAELKIYPNLNAHVLDALQGMVARPAGCGEQITSLAFGSLLALKALRKAGQDNPALPGNPNAALARRALKYLNDAYVQLRDLQTPDGGIPYWHNGESNIAVTAYVLEFLIQASGFIEVDAEKIDHARNFLVRAQQADGGWRVHAYPDQWRPDANLSALVARSLAISMKAAPDKNNTVASDNDKQKPAVVLALVPALDKAMTYLESRVSVWNDPYLVGQYAIAAAVLGRPGYTTQARTRLLELAHEEGAGAYWNLEANYSPFYGWGSAGRLETTGLAVQALAMLDHAAGEKSSPNLTSDSILLDRGLFFLLNHKDRYSGWHSTQASVKVMQAIVEASPSEADGPEQATTARVMINGKEGPVLKLPSARELTGPVVSDISAWLQPGANRIEVLRAPNAGALQAQITASHYVRWADSQATRGTNFKPGDNRALRLNVSFDATEAGIGQKIHCTVKAERIGFEGYGMMLAEIGLPPGAEVDRQSLQQALEKWEVQEYEVQPDRVVLYLWPQAGGSNVSFSFKPRFAMEATATPSVLYDYYNPEARAVVVPVRFRVH
ncbi:MAG TPA: hypothetical protein VNW97_11710, partial [Candidatus Saccharimonadales bacterium]|nr:hypothetical protein [Candidatus Saccharimonadales bacterium]